MDNFKFTLTHVVWDWRVMKSAIIMFGKEKLRLMCIEECAELINALAKETRDQVTNDQIIDEIADVMIMCKQMAIIYGNDEVNNRITSKFTRLKELMEIEGLR